MKRTHTGTNPLSRDARDNSRIAVVLPEPSGPQMHTT